jgi:hypothetical protein
MGPPRTTTRFEPNLEIRIGGARIDKKVRQP